METESLMGSSWQWDESPVLWMNCQLYQLLTMVTTHWFYWRQVQHSVTRCTLQTSHSSYFDECIGLICSTWIYGIHLISTWIAVTSYLIYFNQVSLYSSDFHFSGTILFYFITNHQKFCNQRKIPLNSITPTTKWNVKYCIFQ